jgi:NAD(P)-dependent dehydrogenase (short-subunit alcohol dehydrogenase family)
LRQRMNLKNRPAIVTGAASGVGRAIAVSLARRGSCLALADIDEDGLIGIERRAKRVLVGSDAKMIAIVERLAPAAYPAILERLRGAA